MFFGNAVSLRKDVKIVLWQTRADANSPRQWKGKAQFCHVCVIFISSLNHIYTLRKDSKVFNVRMLNVEIWFLNYVPFAHWAMDFSIYCKNLKKFFNWALSLFIFVCYFFCLVHSSYLQSLFVSNSINRSQHASPIWCISIQPVFWKHCGSWKEKHDHVMSNYSFCYNVFNSFLFVYLRLLCKCSESSTPLSMVLIIDHSFFLQCKLNGTIWK